MPLENTNEYHFDDNAEGHQLITGTGKLFFNGVLFEGEALPVSNRPEGTAYLLQSGDLAYLLTRKDAATHEVSATGTDLEIMRTTGNGDNTVTVNNFADGQFGITLKNPVIAATKEIATSSDTYETHPVSSITYGNGNTLVITQTGSSESTSTAMLITPEGEKIKDFTLAGNRPFGALMSNSNIMVITNPLGSATVISPNGDILLDGVMIGASQGWARPIENIFDVTDYMGRVAVLSNNGVAQLDNNADIMFPLYGSSQGGHLFSGSVWLATLYQRQLAFLDVLGVPSSTTLTLPYEPASFQNRNIAQL